MSDNPDNGLAEDEETTRHLFALLYPDEDSSSEVDDPSYEDDAELGDFRSLLGHFRDMPEEEPSAAVSNMLLAMAAKHAPAAKNEESKGFLARLSDWLLPTVYHPGLASAATLVLVAGLAGTLYVNGKSQVAEPQVATQAAAPQLERSAGNEALGTARLGEDPSAAAADSPADSLRQELAEAEAEQDLADDEAPDETEAQEPTEDRGGLKATTSSSGFEDDSSSFKAEAKRDRSLDGNVGGLLGSEGGAGKGNGGANNAPKLKNKEEGVAGPGQGDVGGSDTRANRKTTKTKPVVTAPSKPEPSKTAPDEDKAPSPKEITKDDAKSTNKTPTNSKSEEEPAPAPAAEPTPPPPPKAGVSVNEKKPSPPLEDSVGDDDDADESEGEEVAPTKKPAAPAEDSQARAAALHKQAITAAKNNQCAKVKSLGQSIRKLSSAYYDRTFLSDKKLTDCLAPEVKK